VARAHIYEVTVTWTGNTGTGTSAHRDYDRDHEVAADGPPPIAASSDRHTQQIMTLTTHLRAPALATPVPRSGSATLPAQPALFSPSHRGASRQAITQRDRSSASRCAHCRRYLKRLGRSVGSVQPRRTNLLHIVPLATNHGT
jgi:hypothetical protein